MNVPLKYVQTYGQSNSSNIKCFWVQFGNKLNEVTEFTSGGESTIRWTSSISRIARKMISFDNNLMNPGFQSLYWNKYLVHCPHSPIPEVCVHQRERIYPTKKRSLFLSWHRNEITTPFSNSYKVTRLFFGTCVKPINACSLAHYEISSRHFILFNYCTRIKRLVQIMK